MEFRTRPPGSDGGEDGGDSGGNNDVVEKLFQQTKKQLAKDPEKRVQLASALQENYGIDPQITSLFVPGLDEDIKQAQKQVQESQNNVSNGQNNMGNQTKEMPQEVENETTVEDIQQIIGKAKTMLGEETTLEELEEIMENNPSQIRGLIQTYL